MANKESINPTTITNELSKGDIDNSNIKSENQPATTLFPEITPTNSRQDPLLTDLFQSSLVPPKLPISSPIIPSQADGKQLNNSNLENHQFLNIVSTFNNSIIRSYKIINFQPNFIDFPKENYFQQLQSIFKSSTLKTFFQIQEIAQFIIESLLILGCQLNILYSQVRSTAHKVGLEIIFSFQID
ncbi:hypothetical protein PPL_05793 [Heterostelium album PN500]|uniref:Uncharacterized protein n=1 Tax=Heterostelium pallidum (strain ATCC 26659 / Pp 5 / PN500) TaxID=670386 RepID=D3BB61_HETP5|nr:hypothetical protein PPL_05793 [Heterostelium album PN500]EFA81798.1 hypothetical protein PPL_05793 [Heterostelium album PN500]|eukprot:XP_020433915.1 hypothetical protein PPL_05793 [Heterostelium album PN500]